MDEKPPPLSEGKPPSCLEFDNRDSRKPDYFFLRSFSGRGQLFNRGITLLFLNSSLGRQHLDLLGNNAPQRIGT